MASVNIFTRREVCSTNSMEEQAKIRDLLSDNHIHYHIKTVNMTSSSPFFAGSRSRTGSFGVDYNYAYQYIFYVHKNDVEKAKYILNKK